MNIIFICTGNTCRSPMAEGYLKSKAISDLNVFSRGLAADGSPVSKNSVIAMEEKGIDISKHISKPITIEDIQNADKLICLSNSHMNFLSQIPNAKEKLLLLGGGISDPYGADLTVYRQCRDEIISAINKIINIFSCQNFKVSFAKEEHLEQIAELEEACFSKPWSYEILKDAYKHGTQFLVCLKENKLLGYVGVNIILDEGYITNVAVFPEWRRQGVATEILKNLAKFTLNQKLSFLSLEVRVSNSSAIALYENFGFKIEGKRKQFYKNPSEDAYIMTKRFDSNENFSN